MSGYSRGSGPVCSRGGRQPSELAHRVHPINPNRPESPSLLALTAGSRRKSLILQKKQREDLFANGDTRDHYPEECRMGQERNGPMDRSRQFNLPCFSYFDPATRLIGPPPQPRQRRDKGVTKGCREGCDRLDPEDEKYAQKEPD